MLIWGEKYFQSMKKNIQLPPFFVLCFIGIVVGILIYVFDIKEK